jgi:hypothetical protein
VPPAPLVPMKDKHALVDVLPLHDAVATPAATA